MEIPESHQRDFRTALLRWFDTHKRKLPWRDSADPYRIWLSEVMLQQTRVDQALPYYTRFLAAFPTVEALAAANLDAVLLLWEGLGYYARARHLHQAAGILTKQYEGMMPSDYGAIRSLPGVGTYTAGAIASIAFGMPYPAVDGNARRVLARCFALRTPTPATLLRLASQLLDPARPGDFNQALMEAGATVCTPASPRCPACPLGGLCAAKALSRQEDFPAKKVKNPVPHYDIAAGIVLDDEGRLLIQRRAERALLGGLWEFPGGKRTAGETLQQACQRELMEELGITVAVGELLTSVRHAYTHFRITLYAFRCHITAGIPVSSAGLPVRWVPLNELGQYAFPRANRRVLDALGSSQRNKAATPQYKL